MQRFLGTLAVALTLVLGVERLTSATSLLLDPLWEEGDGSDDGGGGGGDDGGGGDGGGDG